MIDIENFTSKYITHREESLFWNDIVANKKVLSKEILGKKVLVIGGAGTIGSSFIRAILPFKPSKLTVIDINENGLTELTRDIRSRYDMYVPNDYVSYSISYADPIFEKIFRRANGFDIVANFSAHKHVRSEKDEYSVEAMFENNVIKAKRLMDLLVEIPPRHFFCVSTDKAANPVNVMGGSKKIMEAMIMSYSDKIKVSTARFANVAFSNGSLLDGFIERLMKKQPIAAPSDIKRYFVSPDESGQICMLACILGENRQIFFPKLREEQMLKFSSICNDFLQVQGYKIMECKTESGAKKFASEMRANSKEYPVFYFNSDTTGEKEYEEFYTDGEELDMNKFESLGVIKNYNSSCNRPVGNFLKEMKELFERNNYTKDEVIELINTFIPNFQHKERGKNLDQKM